MTTMQDPITKAATRATAMKKPNKKEAHEIVRELISKGALTGHEAAALYAYFMPSVPARPKTPEQWVARAVAVNDVRAYLKYLYSDGKRLIASDGHRLHLCPTELPEGYYDTNLQPLDSKNMGKYPDVDRVTPKDGETHTVTAEQLQVEEFGKPVTYVYRLPHGVMVNKKYWDDAASHLETTTYLVGESRAVRIDYEDGRLAVIMPLRD